MDIGRRVREVREDLGMQRTVLARRVGVAENTIYRIETGERTPSVGLLEKIARELRTEPAELLREPAPKASAPSNAGRTATPQTAYEPEEGLSPTLEHTFDIAFWKFVVEQREAGFDDRAIARRVRVRADQLERAK
jgi:transcriptional regulator with XRE-family HTH domain